MEIIIVKEKGNLANAEEFRRMFNARFSRLTNGTYEVKISRVRKKRTTDQNSLYWMWLRCVADETGNTTDDLHEYCKRKFLTPRAVEIAGEQMEVAPSTTKLDTAEMTTYLNGVQAWAASELGITLPTPEDRFYDDFEQEYNY